MAIFNQNQSNGNIFKVKKSHISLIHRGGRQGRQIGNVGSQSSIVYKGTMLIDPDPLWIGGAIGGAVGGALETVSSIERAGPPELPQLPSIPQIPLPSIPSIPNPFNQPVQVQPQQNEEIVEEKLGVDEEDINEENTLKELGPQEFCQQKSSSNNSAETVIWDLQNLSIFAQILQNSNITDQDERWSIQINSLS